MARKAASKFVLRKNDRIVFLGDSITEQQLYTNYVETYLATRYPDHGFTFFNAGWGGDTAPGGCLRLERDVLSLKPDVVTICYGMNDAGYQLPSPDILRCYAGGMDELIKRLKKQGVRIVLLTPGYADVTVNSNLAACDYNNKGLRALADHVLKLAKQEKLPVGDLHKLMTEVDAKAKAADAKFNMAPDGVHPDPAGHLVMAYGVLKALGVPENKVELRVDLKKQKTHAPKGCKIGKLDITHTDGNAKGVGFQVALRQLPFFVEPAARKVLPFLPFQETFNNWALAITALGEGRFFLRSGLERSETKDAAIFAAGLNLAELWGSPPMQQAAAMHRYTQEKDQVFYKLWRVLALNSANGPFYNKRAHSLGRKAMEQLEEARQELLADDQLRLHVSVMSSDLPGEPLFNGDFITHWSFRGSFPLPWDYDYLDGEAKITQSVPTLDAQWIKRDLDFANLGNSLVAIFGPVVNCSGYALTVIESPADQSAALWIGSDDGFAVWLNGQKLADKLAVKRGISVDQDNVPVVLRKGKNVLLIKISQDLGGWGLCARFKDLRHAVAAGRAPGGS